MRREYKDNITIDEVKSGEIIRTDARKHYIVIRLGRLRPRFIELDLSKEVHEITGKIEAVFSYNGEARILPTEKEI